MPDKPAVYGPAGGAHPLHSGLQRDPHGAGAAAAERRAAADAADGSASPQQGSCWPLGHAWRNACKHAAGPGPCRRRSRRGAYEPAACTPCPAHHSPWPVPCCPQVMQYPSDRSKSNPALAGQEFFLELWDIGAHPRYERECPPGAAGGTGSCSRGSAAVAQGGLARSTLSAAVAPLAHKCAGFWVRSPGGFASAALTRRSVESSPSSSAACRLLQPCGACSTRA